jgi:hypothetical protein
MKKTLLLLLFSYCSFAQLKEYTFEGKINEKIPVKFALIVDGSLIEGFIIYTRVGQPIKIIGSLEGDNMLLHEFLNKDQIVGGFNATRTKEGFSGVWFSTKQDAKELNFTVKKTSEKDIEKQKTETTGTYAYSLGKNSGSGMMYVQQGGSGNLVVSILATRGAPSYNQAILDKVTFKMTGNEAIYESTEFGKCKLKATFSNNAASIIYLEDAFDCGFGNAASVVGSYFKTDSKPPKFPKLGE